MLINEYRKTVSNNNPQQLLDYAIRTIDIEDSKKRMIIYARNKSGFDILMSHFSQLYSIAQNRPKPSRLPFKTIYRENNNSFIIERALEPALTFLKLSNCFSNEAYDESISALKAESNDELNCRRSISMLYD